MTAVSQVTAGSSALGVIDPGGVVDLTLARAIAEDASPLCVAALDGWAPEQIRALGDREGYCPVYMPTADGLAAHVPTEVLAPHIQRAIERLEQEGAEVIVLMCAADFPTFRSSLPLVIPGRQTVAFARGLGLEPEIAVVVPVPEQIESMRRKWSAAGFLPTVVAVQPDQQGTRAWDRAMESMRGHSAVVLDCMGFTSAHAAEIRERLHTLPILATEVTRAACRALRSSLDERRPTRLASGGAQ